MHAREYMRESGNYLTSLLLLVTEINLSVQFSSGGVRGARDGAGILIGGGWAIWTVCTVGGHRAVSQCLRIKIK